MSIRRAGFPKDNLIWRVDWIGALRPNPNMYTERLIEVAISPVMSVAKPDRPTRAEALNCDSRAQEIILLNAGLLPSLVIGSVWRNGTQLPVVDYQKFEAQVDLRSTNVRLIRAGHKDGEEYVIPAHQYPLGFRWLDTPCAAIGIGDDPYALIIPCAEILRAWLGRSTAFLMRLLSGSFEMARDQIVDRELTEAVEDGFWEVQLRRGLSGCDAMAAGIMNCTEYGERQVREMLDALLLGSQQKAPQWINLLPPVESAGTLQARGVRITSVGRNRFLVFDLMKIPGPTGLRSLEWEVEGASRAEVEHIEDDDPDKVKRPSHGSPDPDDEVTAQEEPAIDGAVIIERYRAPQIETEARIQRATAGDTKVVSIKVAKKVLEPGPKKLSTGGGKSGKTESLPMQIKPESRPNALLGTGTLAQIIAEIERIPNSSCGLVYPTDNPILHPLGHLWRMPTTRSTTEICRWSLVEGKVRAAVVVCITHEGRNGYLFEIERRPAIPNVRQDQERLCCALFVPDLNTEIDVPSLLQQCVDAHGIWLEKLDGYAIGKFKHTKSPRGFAYAFVNFIRARNGHDPLKPDASDQVPDTAKQQTQVTESAAS